MKTETNKEKELRTIADVMSKYATNHNIEQTAILIEAPTAIWLKATGLDWLPSLDQLECHI